MSKLHLIHNYDSIEERIQARIESFRLEMLQTEDDLNYVRELIDLCLDHLSQYHDDPTLNQAYIRLNETFMWLDVYFQVE